jgi:O-antigen ligase
VRTRRATAEATGHLEASTPPIAEDSRVLALGIVAVVVLQPLALSPVTNETTELPKLIVLRVILFGSFVLMALQAVRTHTGAVALRLPTQWSPLLGAVVVLGSWTIATAVSPSPAVALWGVSPRWSGLHTQASYVALFLAAAYWLRRQRAVELVAMALASVAALVSLYACLQAAGWDPLPWSYSVSGQFLQVEARERPFATLGNPDFLAAYLVLTVPLSTVLVISRNRESLAIRGAIITSIALQLLAVVFTRSRAGWTGVAVGAVIMLSCWLGSKWRNVRLDPKAVAGVLLLTVVAAVASVAWLVSSYVGNDTIAVRIELWRVVSRVVLDAPFMGFGPGILGSVIDRHYTPRLVDLENTPAFLIDRAHNLELDALASAGVLGAIALAGVAWSVFIRLTGHIRMAPNDDGRGRWLVIGVFAALAGHIVEQQFSIETAVTSTLAWLLAGIAIGQGKGATGQQFFRTAPASSQRVTCLPVLILIASALVFAGEVAVDSRLFAADMAYARGVAAERAGDREAATSALGIAASQWPFDSAYTNELAKVESVIAKSQNDDSRLHFQRATDALDMALRADPARAQLWSNLGLLAGEAGTRLHENDFASIARAAHERATSLAPAYWPYWRNRGISLLQLGDYGGAIVALSRAVDLYQTDQNSWDALGFAAERTNNLGLARHAWSRALQLNNSDQIASRGLERLSP